MAAVTSGENTLFKKKKKNADDKNFRMRVDWAEDSTAKTGGKIILLPVRPAFYPNVFVVLHESFILYLFLRTRTKLLQRKDRF